MSEYWQSYNPNTDFDALSAPIQTNQSTTGFNLNLQKAGYDPVWIWETYGDRLKLLPGDLYNAIFEAMCRQDILSPAWGENAGLFIPEILE